jgi:hypothetical protein
VLGTSPLAAHATTTDLVGPAASGQFGETVDQLLRTSRQTEVAAKSSDVNDSGGNIEN